jgi:hypothetical protein
MLNQNRTKKTSNNFIRRKRSRKENKNSQILKEKGSNITRIMTRNRNSASLGKNTPEKGSDKIFANLSKNLHKFENCKTVMASENDFKNILKFIDCLWSKEEASTGIIKITPPGQWKKANDFIFENFYFPNFNRSEKKLETRIQNLGGLFKGQVNYSI